MTVERVMSGGSVLGGAQLERASGTLDTFVVKVKKIHYSTKKLDTIRHLIPYVIYVCRAIVGRLAACNMEMK